MEFGIFRKPAPRRDSLEEALAGVLETLSHQTDLLEELLRRTEKGDGGPSVVALHRAVLPDGPGLQEKSPGPPCLLPHSQV